MRFDYDTKNDALSNATSTAMQVDARKHMKLYKMISSTLYADKHTSILRELCSNARDSHQEAGKLHVPFAITAPTESYPFMTIEDVGIGLDYEGAKPTVLTFLGSTKDEGEDADDYIGGWGIGAKAPRAYSSNYQIVCRKNGVEYFVQVYDKDGLPQHTLMMERKTDRKNGLEFIVPILQADIKMWRDKIRKYMSFTNYNVIAYFGEGEVVHATPPNASIDYDKFSADMYGVMQKAYASSQSASNVTVTYGGMQYPIPSEMGVGAIVEAIKKELAYGIEMRIRVNNANALSFGLSRESIEITPENTEFVRSALQQVLDDVTLAIKTNAKVAFSNGSTATTWEQVLAADDAVRAMSEVESNGRFMAFTRRMTRSVTWSANGLRKKTRMTATELESASSVYLGLPLQPGARVAPKVKVLWSKRRPMSRDWASVLATDELALINYLPCESEEEAKDFVASCRSVEGLELTYVEVQSTRGRRTYSKGTNANTGAKFAVCTLRGTRQKILEDHTYVIVDSKENFWLDKMFAKVKTFVPSRGFLSRETPDNVMAYDDFIESDEYVKMLESVKGWHISQETVTTMYAGIRTLDRFTTGRLPESVAAEVRVARDTLEKLLTRTQHAKEAMRISFDTTAIPKDLTVDDAITYALGKASTALHLLVKNEDLFSVIDFKTLARALAAENPEAKRLVCAMNLEQYL